MVYRSDRSMMMMCMRMRMRAVSAARSKVSANP